MEQHNSTSNLDSIRQQVSETLRHKLEALPSAQRLSDEQLEVLYALAYAQVAQQQYEQALPLFSLLCLYGPTRQHYLCGFALCLQQQELYLEAGNIYALVWALFPEHYESAIGLVECQLASEQLDQALATLDNLVQIAQQQSAAPAWLPKVLAMRQLLQGDCA
ncbi:tetratricopeptide repeat protein [Alcaligenes endophyticus]|uniref:Tetratricopeptide repeat protein n=1 Tax=Alcaligenes endophyticus TaxID=1929088 RepID=A0ABT8EFY4_9BURK|nr:tetratricopeptide repeat protein [Alcaligenes endophyticus]MCX5590271.1 tetratricopeptide repeat protein [Alcaligenes endophyticus]MDN4120065.1 tetratricopeptide repeat protein [Alcaligenes endophyticus]